MSTRTALSLCLLVLGLAACRVEEPETEPSYNQAGCDVIGGSCGAQGRCCDTHDDCIDQQCAPGFGAIGACTLAAIARGDCTAACRACGTAAAGCFARCNTIGGPACGPSVCCGDAADPDDDTCGDEQACYDRTKMPAELITDPCVCEARGIDLSPSPPRPEGHCCDDTGWGCCAAKGETPGPGGAKCCAPLVTGDDGTCEDPPES